MYRDCTKPGHGPQEIDLGEVADVIHDRLGAAATGGVLSLMEQLAAARRPGCLDKAGTTLGTPGSARHQAAIPAASLSRIGGYLSFWRVVGRRILCKRSNRTTR